MFSMEGLLLKDVINLPFYSSKLEHLILALNLNIYDSLPIPFHRLSNIFFIAQSMLDKMDFDRIVFKLQKRNIKRGTPF